MLIKNELFMFFLVSLSSSFRTWPGVYKLKSEVSGFSSWFIIRDFQTSIEIEQLKSSTDPPAGSMETS